MKDNCEPRVGEQCTKPGNQCYRKNLKYYVVDKVEKSGETKSRKYIKKIPTYGSFKSKHFLNKYLPEVNSESDTFTCERSASRSYRSPRDTSYSLQNTSHEISSNKCFCLDNINLPIEHGDKEKLFRDVEKHARILGYDEKTLYEVPTISEMIRYEAITCNDFSALDDATSFSMTRFDHSNVKSTDTKYIEREDESEKEISTDFPARKLDEKFSRVNNYLTSMSNTNELKTESDASRILKKIRKKKINPSRWCKQNSIKCNSKRIRKNFWKSFQNKNESPEMENNIETKEVKDSNSLKLDDLDIIFNSLYETLFESTLENETHLHKPENIDGKHFSKVLMQDSSESKLSSMSDFPLYYDYISELKEDNKTKLKQKSTSNSTLKNEVLSKSSKNAEPCHFRFSNNLTNIISDVCDTMFYPSKFSRQRKEKVEKDKQSSLKAKMSSIMRKRSNKCINFLKNMKLIKKKKLKDENFENNFEELIHTICSDIAEDEVILNEDNSRRKENDEINDHKSVTNSFSDKNLDKPIERKILKIHTHSESLLQSKNEIHKTKQDAGDTSSRENKRRSILSPASSKEHFQITMDDGEITTPFSQSSLDVRPEIPSRSASNIRIRSQSQKQRPKSCTTDSLTRLSYPKHGQRSEKQEIKAMLNKMHRVDMRNPLTKIANCSEESDCVSCAVFSDFEKYHKSMCSLKSLDNSIPNVVSGDARKKKYGEHMVDLVFDKEQKPQLPHPALVDPDYSFYIIGSPMELEVLIQPFRTALFKRFLKYISHRTKNFDSNTCCKVCKQKRALIYKDLRVFVLENKFDITFDISEAQNPVMKTDKAYLIRIVGKEYKNIRAGYAALLNKLPDIAKYICAKKGITDGNSTTYDQNLNFYNPIVVQKRFRNRRYLNNLDHPPQKHELDLAQLKIEHSLHIPLKQETRNKTLKFLATSHLEKLFRKNKQGEFISQRLIDLEDKYNLKFDNVSIALVPKFSRTARMIHITIKYKNYKDLEVVTGLLENFIKTSNDKI